MNLASLAEIRSGHKLLYLFRNCQKERKSEKAKMLENAQENATLGKSERSKNVVRSYYYDVPQEASDRL